MKKDLTLQEKLTLLTGKNLWQTDDLQGKLASVFFSDGPCGLRKMKKDEKGDYQDIPSIAYPSPVNIANSFDTENARLIGELIAEDCIEEDVDVLLAPGVNIKRTPLCGRNFEYYSEDPYLSGMMAKAFIEGVQSKGVGTSLKHFCTNNREIGRYYQSSEVDERTLRETYTRAFEIALEASPTTVMCSYNPVNGVYASENKYLLTDLLRNKLGFKGVIISDWLAVHNSYKALNAGLDLRMPYHENALPQLMEAYEKGLITEETVNNSVERILQLINSLNASKDKRIVTYDKEERRALSLKVAQESMVLLKNNGVLPLNGTESICVIGELNKKPHIGGGGSACVASDYTQPFLSDLLCQALETEIVATKFNFLNSLDPNHNDREAYILAETKDVSIIVVGNNSIVECEGSDRSRLTLSEKEERLIKNVAACAKKTVVVIEAGSAIDVSNWIDEVDAVLFAGYAGDQTNRAISDILSGKVCPCGKLSETFPLSLNDTYCKSDSGKGNYEVYNDRIFVGYKYYDEENIAVRYPFGYGLSYAKFEYSNLAIEKLGDAQFKVRFDVKNNSNIDGKEIVQLYVRDLLSMVPRPQKELCAFEKKLIKAGKTKTFHFLLDQKAFSYYDVNTSDWKTENGSFEILVGSDSRNILLKSIVTVTLPEETQSSLV